MFGASWDSDAEMYAARRHTLPETALAPAGDTDDIGEWFGADADGHAILDQPGVFGDGDSYLDALLASELASADAPPATICPSSPDIFCSRFDPPPAPPRQEAPGGEAPPRPSSLSPPSSSPRPAAAVPEVKPNSPTIREPTLPAMEHHAYVHRPIVMTRALAESEFGVDKLQASMDVVERAPPLAAPAPPPRAAAVDIGTNKKTYG